MKPARSEIAHILFIDLVAWSQSAMEAQAESLDQLTKAFRATPAFLAEERAGTIECLPTGDGFAALFFGDLTAPIQCALELSTSLNLSVRMGIHSGPVQKQTDVGGKLNFVGDGINMAKRVLDAAEPGQILASEAYASWLKGFQKWKPLLTELGPKTAKHGVEICLYSVARPAKSSKPTAGKNGKRLVVLYRRNAQPDQRLMELLESRLGDLGHSVFIDRHLRIGVDWAKSIENEIRESDAAIVLLSDAALGSEMMEAEVEIAHQERDSRGAPVLLPVRIASDRALTGPIAPFLGGLHFGVWNSEDDTDALLKGLVKSLSDPPALNIALEPDSGSLSPDSLIYVERSADPQFHEAIRRQESIILVKAARQMGKTSLLARGSKTAHTMDARLVFTDFQKFSGALIENEDSFYKALTALTAQQIDFEYDFDRLWKSVFGASLNMDAFIRAALNASPDPIIWFMDEADKLFTAPFASDFYGLVRSWHNSRAIDAGGPWKKLIVVISYATEAHLFIRDLNQSPFNVGRVFNLEEFDATQVRALSGLVLGKALENADLESLMGLVGGQPFLVRRALSAMAAGSTLEDLKKNAIREDGPFGDHLKRLLVSISRLDIVLGTTRDLLGGLPATDPEATSRLLASGVVVQDDDGRHRMRNELYRSYLAGHL